VDCWGESFVDVWENGIWTGLIFGNVTWAVPCYNPALFATFAALVASGFWYCFYCQAKRVCENYIQYHEAPVQVEHQDDTKHLHRLGSLISVFIWDSFFSWEVETTLRNLTDDNRETKGTESRTRRFLWSMLWTRISIIFFPSFDYSALVRQYCLTKCFQGLCTITSVLKTWKCAR
jgi:hypothetical protein